MVPQVFVAGQPVAALAPVGDLVISHEWPASGIGGPVSTQFTLLLPAAKRPDWLRKGTRAEVRMGGWPMLAGKLAEPAWDSGTITIDGAAREGSNTACLTAAGVTSSTPDPVIDAAITRSALTWSRPASISNTPLTDGDETARLNNVQALLAAYADESGARLYVDPSRRLLKGADPTRPWFFITAGAGELDWASEKQADALIGRWANATGVLTNTTVGSGEDELLLDLTGKGPLDLTRATNILKNLLVQATSGGWANGITVNAGQFAGGPHLAAVADQVGRGLMARNLGQQDPREGFLPVPFVDFIVERSEWHVADQQIILTPRGMVARDFAAILADAGVEAA